MTTILAGMQDSLLLLESSKSGWRTLWQYHCIIVMIRVVATTSSIIPNSYVISIGSSFLLSIAAGYI